MNQTVTNSYHIPVMVPQCIEGLNIRSDGFYVDATYGGGGHAAAILNKLGKTGRLMAFDQDLDAADRVSDHDNLIFVNHNFQYLKNYLTFYTVEKVDGILADLGISSHQINVGERGFSFRYDAPLDMRMDQAGDLTAATVVNTYDVEELSRIFKLYGEIRFGWKLAQKIVAIRQDEPIETTEELAEIVSEFIPPHRRNKEIAQIFQALRIEVNGELASLRSFLQHAIDVLVPGGRLVIMSYHSLEDRLVKSFMTSGNQEGKTAFDAFGRIEPPMKLVGRKPITPTPEEIEKNPRSRSAKLRIAEKL